MSRTTYSILSISIFLMPVFIIITGFTLPSGDETKSTNGGELTFTVRTVSAGGNYSPKHVLAIWIEHDGDFIKTRKAMANQRKQYLYTWKAASNYNVVDAITGSTLTSHQTHTVNWDCTDLDGNIVPDGDYDVYAEFTDEHAQGPLYMLTFNKGTDEISLSPADETYFKDLELSFIPYVSEFSYDTDAICQWETVTFSDESVNATSWEWDFGEGAAPATANTQGPHTVYYTSPGEKSVSLTINESVTEIKESLIEVTATPTAEFSYSSNALTVNFTNTSANASTYLWDFGDGNTSNENNPTHTYSIAGAYVVVLTAFNQECEDYQTEEIIVPLVGLDNFSMDPFVRICPNPNQGNFELRINNQSPIKKIDIFAASGKKIRVKSLNDISPSQSTFDVRNLEKGIYFLRLNTEDQIITKKIVVR